MTVELVFENKYGKEITHSVDINISQLINLKKNSCPSVPCLNCLTLPLELAVNLKNNNNETTEKNVLFGPDRKRRILLRRYIK